MKRVLIVLAIIAAALAISVFHAAQYTRSGLADECWAVVTHPYGVTRSLHLSEWGTFSLTRAHDRSVNGFTLVVPRLIRFASWDKFIVGETAEGWFILETAEDSGEPFQWAEAEMLETRQQWQVRLAELGVPADVRLQTPHLIASTRSYEELCPRDYTVLGGALGLPDVAWAYVVAEAFLLSSAVLGLLSLKTSKALVLIALAFVPLNAASAVILSGGGLDGMACMFFIPSAWFLAFLLARVSRYYVVWSIEGVRKFQADRRRKRSEELP